MAETSSLHILGAGHSYGSSELDNELLAELGLAASADEALSQSGFKARKSVLSPDYLKECKNADPMQAFDAVFRDTDGPRCQSSSTCA